MAEGCPEQIDLEFLRYIWRYPAIDRPRTLKALDRNKAWPMTTLLRSDREAAAFLAVAGKA
jgi:hypothetical protein